MNEWGVYYGAHKMMETQHWGLGNHEQSDKLLDNFATGPFAQNLRGECLSKTVRWELVDIYPEETKILAARVSF